MRAFNHLHCRLMFKLQLMPHVSEVYAVLQGELDSIRAELAALRQSIGKNRDHSAGDSAHKGVAHGNGANVGNNNAMPGGNMV